MKFCKYCKGTFPIELFSKNKKMKDGYLNKCKKCACLNALDYYHKNTDACLEKNKRWMEKNKDKRTAYQKEYRVTNAHVIVSWYKANPNYNRAYYLANHAAIRKQSKEYRDSNREQIREAQRYSYARNPEPYRINARVQQSKRRVAGPGYKREDVEYLIKIQKRQCAVCRCKVGEKFHVDHIMPIKLDGNNQRSNLQILCPQCNLKKNAKHPIDFMQSQGFLL